MSPPDSPNKRIKGGLLALGAAAVLTVYSTGFARTRAAAQRFAEQDAVRRPAPSAPSAPSAPVAQAQRAQRAQRAPAQPVAAQAKPVASPAESNPNTTVAAAKPIAASPTTAFTSPTGSPPSAQPPVGRPDSAAKPDSTKARYKDGVYSGWGTSRHGDIEAEVEVKNGRITIAWIKQCLTQYSCSWISALPLQVIDRQGPDVDFVSGATQSVNAFYHAVYEALSKAQ